MKSPLQLWIVDNRKRLGLTPGDLARMTGVTEDTARGWESRGQPSQEALTILQRRFGEPVPAERNDPPDQTALAVALLALTGELRAAREERAATAARLDQMESVLDGLYEQARQGVVTPPSREQTTG